MSENCATCGNPLNERCPSCGDPHATWDHESCAFAQLRATKERLEWAKNLLDSTRGWIADERLMRSIECFLSSSSTPTPNAGEGEGK